MRNSGLPCSAAFCLASQTLGNQSISIQRDSPGCRLIIACRDWNLVSSIDWGLFPRRTAGMTADANAIVAMVYMIRKTRPPVFRSGSGRWS